MTFRRRQVSAVSRPEQLQATSPVGPEDRLDSWKAIAAYLGRGVRTVQRWEREEGLPVHRLAHEKRGSVYARRREVDAWWESRRRSLASDLSDSNSTTGVDSSALAVPTPTLQLERITWKAAATFWPALSSDGRLLAYVSDGGRDDALPDLAAANRRLAGVSDEWRVRAVAPRVLAR